jgi:hypothetical protein
MASTHNSAGCHSPLLCYWELARNGSRDLPTTQATKPRSCGLRTTGTNTELSQLQTAIELVSYQTSQLQTAIELVSYQTTSLRLAEPQPQLPNYTVAVSELQSTTELDTSATLHGLATGTGDSIQPSLHTELPLYTGWLQYTA